MIFAHTCLHCGSPCELTLAMSSENCTNPKCEAYAPKLKALEQPKPIDVPPGHELIPETSPALKKGRQIHRHVERMIQSGASDIFTAPDVTRPAHELAKLPCPHCQTNKLRVVENQGRRGPETVVCDHCGCAFENINLENTIHDEHCFTFKMVPPKTVPEWSKDERHLVDKCGRIVGIEGTRTGRLSSKQPNLSNMPRAAFPDRPIFPRGQFGEGIDKTIRDYAKKDAEVTHQLHEALKDLVDADDTYDVLEGKPPTISEEEFLHPKKRPYGEALRIFGAPTNLLARELGFKDTPEMGSFTKTDLYRNKFLSFYPQLADYAREQRRRWPMVLRVLERGEALNDSKDGARLIGVLSLVDIDIFCPRRTMYEFTAIDEDRASVRCRVGVTLLPTSKERGHFPHFSTQESARFSIEAPHLPSSKSKRWWKEHALLILHMFEHDLSRTRVSRNPMQIEKRLWRHEDEARKGRDAAKRASFSDAIGPFGPGNKMPTKE